MLTTDNNTIQSPDANRQVLNIFNHELSQSSQNCDKPDWIDQKHWDEWIKSWVKPVIIALNVRSLHDGRSVDKALNRNSSKRWRHSDELVPCWQVSGLDPRGWERTLEGVQIKPDISPTDTDGKPQKYLGASGYDAAPLFLDPGTPNYWKEVYEDIHRPIVITEGAKKAGAGLSIGYATVSIPGVSTCRKKGRLHRNLEFLANFGRTFYIAFDNDVTSKKPVQKAILAMACELAAKGAKIMVIEIPQGASKGMDDYIVNHGEDAFHKLVADAKTIEEWRESLERQLSKQLLEEASSEKSRETENPNVAFLQQALNSLYGNKHWISADDKLYCWQGNYYQFVSDDVEIPRISSYCNSYCVFVEGRDGEIRGTYPYAKPAKAKEVLEWIKMRVRVEVQKLNPPGINCTNGVVTIKWENNLPVRVLESHDHSEHYFTYKPLVKYDPQADPTDCERLLECLDKPQQEVLLRNLGASIDLTEVRKRRGRLVRLLLACGLGSNGKDALRQTVSTIFGHAGMTSISLADFAHYDDGRKFALAPLINSRVNWASENPQTARLDKIQSLKLFATGNKLHSERKGKDFIEFDPKAIGIFNLNDVPSLQGTTQAIQDRIAVLVFRKTFKDFPNPDDPNELQADPRFAYDSDFLATSVAPAFLNKMLDSLEALISDGIDYECTTEAFRAMQKENNHLLQFCEDIGLGYDPEGSMGAMDIWNHLEQWYLENGTLTIEDDGKRMWAEQAKPSDRNIKAPNQVIARFKQLFPKAKLVMVGDPIKKKKIQLLKGISIIAHSPAPVLENSAPVPPQLPPQETFINQDLRPSYPSFSNMVTEKNKEVESELESMKLTPKVDQNSSELGQLGRKPDTVSIFGAEIGAELGREAPSTGAETGGKNELEPYSQLPPPQFETLKPLEFTLEVGDRILCYPTKDHADRKKETKATVICVESLDRWFVGCTIEYNLYDYKTKKSEPANARIAGGCPEWILRKL